MDGNGYSSLPYTSVKPWGEGGEERFLVLGNEGNGVGEEVLGKLEEDGRYQAVHLPMGNEVESLNVGVAGGVIMYKFKEVMEMG
jgi:RNA methyltransferase, TrmH family